MSRGGANFPLSCRVRGAINGRRRADLSRGARRQVPGGTAVSDHPPCAGHRKSRDLRRTNRASEVRRSATSRSACDPQFRSDPPPVDVLHVFIHPKYLEV